MLAVREAELLQLVVRCAVSVCGPAHVHAMRTGRKGRGAERERACLQCKHTRMCIYSSNNLIELAFVLSE